jgi:TolA-binding protein
MSYIEDGPVKKLLLLFVVFGVLAGCQKAPTPSAQLTAAPVDQIKSDLAQGRYDEALALAKESAAQAPAGPIRNEILYLQTYSQMVGRGDLGGARVPLKSLVETLPAGNLALEGQKTLADCHFWQGHFQTSAKEYRKLLSLAGGNRWEPYALFQIGLCLLLEDKVTEALTSFKDVVTRFPQDPMAEAAQFSIVNSYLRLQDIKRAKAELNRLISTTHDPALKTQAQDSLQQIVEKEALDRDKGPTS